MILSRGKAQLGSIITTRYDTCWPSLQLIHEWEDVFSANLKLPFVPYTLDNMYTLAKRSGSYDLAFVPVFRHIECYLPNTNTIPILVDCWRQDIDRFEELCSGFPLVYVTSLEAYREIMALGFSGNLLYMPLSISDSQRCMALPEKRIDVIQYGRRNPVLDGWMHRYLIKYPTVSYVTTDYDEVGKVKIISNHHGVIGDCPDRQTLMNALGMARVSLVSSPGMDNSKDTGGYNPVAPRFFEGAAKYCYMLGRYPKNEEFVYCGVDDVCECVEEYDQFEDRLNGMLTKRFDRFDEYRLFLNMHVTSRRVATFLRDVTAWLNGI